MAWCHQATSHYLSQCWPRFMTPNGVIRPQWVNWIKADLVYRRIYVALRGTWATWNKPNLPTTQCFLMSKSLFYWPSQPWYSMWYINYNSLENIYKIRVRGKRSTLHVSYLVHIIQNWHNTYWYRNLCFSLKVCQSVKCDMTNRCHL